MDFSGILLEKYSITIIIIGNESEIRNIFDEYAPETMQSARSLAAPALERAGTDCCRAWENQG